jgi:hypothetical protein
VQRERLLVGIVEIDADIMCRRDALIIRQPTGRGSADYAWAQAARRERASAVLTLQSFFDVIFQFFDRTVTFGKPIECSFVNYETHGILR